MQPNNPENNGVWISREEYERLREVQAPLVVPQLHAVTQAAFEPATNKRRANWQVIVGAMLAVGFYISFTTGTPGYFSIILLLLAAVYLAVTLIDVLRGRSQNPAVAHASNHHGVYKTLGIVMLIIVAAPVLYFGAMLLLFITVFSLGGGRGS